MNEPSPLIRTDSILGGRLRLLQPERGHRAGTDAVLLIAATPPGAGLLIDAGAGVGTAGLGVGLRDPNRRILLVEQDEASAAFARRNIALNGLDSRAEVATINILSAAARRSGALSDNVADMLISNPPFYDPAQVRASPDARRAGAHVTSTDGLIAPWLRAFAALLKPDCPMVMIHRAAAIGDILAACAGRFGDVAVRPVHPRASAPALRILVHAIKGSRAPLRLLPRLPLRLLLWLPSSPCRTLKAS